MSNNMLLYLYEKPLVQKERWRIYAIGVKRMDKKFKTGDIYWINLQGTGSVQQGWHPGIIIQNNKGNKYSRTIEIIPLTTAKKTKLPTHVRIPAGLFGLLRESTAQCEGQRPVDKKDIGEFIGTVNDKILKELSIACLINTPYLKFLTETQILELRMAQNVVNKWS